jgi:hypothetical protein
MKGWLVRELCVQMIVMVAELAGLKNTLLRKLGECMSVFGIP